MIGSGTLFTIGYLIISLWLVAILFLAWEVWRAPVYDEDGITIIRPTKTFKDLFKWWRK